ncbi:BTB/POZ domain-containing protein 18 [Dendroctonus ponderosae]|uniref:BTB/POZ domain-containing protein 18 n=1 Tax=Dendroctonus ponderosae TaxID=77166 RepID=UPI002034F039|nr:BTB/POZ domain-containing protein 18 [Dendroctonus ponderosae]XP_019771663.2 BTB/POZ domain-containing protein 18 [Dendroctonus ponderosae]
MAELDDPPNDQHFCLRWNNFQANITSQFDILRCNEDFTDVTIACEGQRLLAHKVVLSACSPYFKELFKTNPCSHPIVFMRDVEARHIIALMEFMYVGEVNVSQAHLSAFLKTAESLKIRGLTDTSSDADHQPEDSGLYMKPQPLRAFRNSILVNKTKAKNSQVSAAGITTSSQDVPINIDGTTPNIASPATKRSKPETEIRLRKEESMTVNPFALQSEAGSPLELLPKVELPEYNSDDDNEHDDNSMILFPSGNGNADLTGPIDVKPPASAFNGKDIGSDLSPQGFRLRRKKLSENWLPYALHQSGSGGASFYDISPRLFEKREPERRAKLVKLGDGIEIHEDQLRSIKWSDYRKLTRGLATILFSPAELATCSVTGQRWSRAGNGERPVKPALDRAKVQAIISYVAARFPMVEVSRIKQVLAYKCKENSTAFKMKAVRYYGHGEKHSN